VGEEELAAIREVFQAGSLSHGPQVVEFEHAFARLIGVPHAVAMSSWTSAAFLVCAYLREGFGPGEIILPSYTFVASANVVACAGLTPRFADVDWASHEVTVETLEPLVNERTRGIMVVHFGGRPCDMPAISEFAARHRLPMIEDSAECLGAKVGGRQAGSYGIGIFSFYSTKNITTGEGGMVVTADGQLADWLRIRMAHGVRKGSFTRDGAAQRWFRNAVAPGHNFRLSNFQAAMGLVQLSKLQQMNSRRRAVARAYDSALRGLSGVERPDLLPDGEHSFQMYVVRVPATERDRILTRLIEDGVEASVHFDPPVHEQTAYASPAVRLPVTERLSRSAVTLPISSVQTTEQTEFVIDSFRRAMRP